MKPCPRLTASLLGSLLLLSLLGAGCSPSRMPTMSPVEGDGPASAALTRAVDEPSAAGAGFYPLALGNTWHFAGRLTVTEYPANAPPSVDLDQARAVTTDLTCVETRNGRDYVVERSLTLVAGVEYTDYVRMREDGAGLFEADIASDTPPDCAGDAAVAMRGPGAPGPGRGGDPADALEAGLRGLDAARRERVSAALRDAWSRLGVVRELLPGPSAYGRPGDGVGAGELTRLRYPLRPGQRWYIRDEPGFRFESIDDGVISLATPVGRFPAHQIRVVPPVLGPNDFVITYYGRSGFLGVTAHFESVSTDEGGNVTGRMVVEDQLILDGISLAGAAPR